MAIGKVTRNSQGISNRGVGTFTGDGTATTVALGFRPMSLKLVNLTDGTVVEKIDGMTDAQTLKTAASGALTVATDSAIVLNDRGFTVLAAIAINAKAFVWYAD